MCQSTLKNTILSRFAIFLGSRNPPTPAGVRRFRLKKPALRSAAFGGLPSLPPGVHLDNQTGTISRFIFGINFSYHFWHAFFPTFYASWCPFGSPLAPFGHFGCILGSILPPFWLTFASNLHTFF